MYKCHKLYESHTEGPSTHLTVDWPWQYMQKFLKFVIWVLTGWLDCLCPLWLARVINLVLVLWHSIENRSNTKWINSYRLLSVMDNNQTHNFFLFHFYRLLSPIGLQLIRLLLSLLIISLSIDYTWLRYWIIS